MLSSPNRPTHARPKGRHRDARGYRRSAGGTASTAGSDQTGRGSETRRRTVNAASRDWRTGVPVRRGQLGRHRTSLAPTRGLGVSRRGLVAVVIAAGLVAACGTRVAHKDVVAAAQGNGQAGASLPSAANGGGAAPNDSGEFVAPARGPAEAASTTVPGAPTASTVASRTATTVRSTGATTTSQPSAGNANASTNAAGATAATKDAILLGNVGSYTGLSSSQGAARDLP